MEHFQKSEAFVHLKESCPAMLLELLETFASVDDNSSLTLSRKRSGSSIYGQDLADGAAAESVNPNLYVKFSGLPSLSHGAILNVIFCGSLTLEQILSEGSVPGLNHRSVYDTIW
ncbi:hypothetical protein V8G54_019712 [Vigna mungo]|uniref:Uncharacterized protein n=1 Tax=Vigna mungo TaxID=3915 RepID=A0AAQ3NCE1_VIGMU